jgi:SNF2 family DNA or RNA helicase
MMTGWVWPIFHQAILPQFTHKILVQNTLEEKIDALIKRKRGIINGVIDAELEGEKFWTRRELLEILRPL